MYHIICLSLSKGRQQPLLPSHPMSLFLSLSARDIHVRFNYALFFFYFVVFYFRWHVSAGSMHLLTSLFLVVFASFLSSLFLTLSRVPKRSSSHPYCVSRSYIPGSGAGMVWVPPLFLYAVLCVVVVLFFYPPPYSSVPIPVWVLCAVLLSI